MGREFNSDYNGYSIHLWAEHNGTEWAPVAKVELRLGDALVPKNVDVPGTYPTEDAAVDFAIDWIREQISEKKIR